MPRADQSVIDHLTEYFAVMEAKHYDQLADYFADGVRLTFGNSPIVVGKPQVVAQLASIGARVDRLGHRLVNVWQQPDGVLILEVDSLWRFPDGFSCTIRACSIFTLVEGRFTDQRIYVDNSPLGDRLD